MGVTGAFCAFMIPSLIICAMARAASAAMSASGRCDPSGLNIMRCRFWVTQSHAAPSGQGGVFEAGCDALAALVTGAAAIADWLPPGIVCVTPRQAPNRKIEAIFDQDFLPTL